MKNKAMSKYDPIPFTITYMNHALITAAREDKIITHNISFFKHFNLQNQSKQLLNMNKLKAPKEPLKPKGIQFYFKKRERKVIINEAENENISLHTEDNENRADDNISNIDEISDDYNYFATDEENSIIDITKSEAEELEELNNNIQTISSRSETQLIHSSSDPEIFHGQNTERVLRHRSQKIYIYKRKYTKQK
jgi:hypothetical protein